MLSQGGGSCLCTYAAFVMCEIAKGEQTWGAIQTLMGVEFSNLEPIAITLTQHQLKPVVNIRQSLHHCRLALFKAPVAIQFTLTCV